MEGWISIYRQIQDNWIWKSNEPFDKRSAWIDLLLIVNHEDQKINFDRDFIEVKRGQKITSIKKLAERWKWSRHKVSDFLDGLEKDMMIVQKRDTKKTLITIVNYEKYQHTKINSDIVKDNKRTTKGQVKDTNNNDNNIYLTLFNKYKERIKQIKFWSEKIKIANQIKEDEEFLKLTQDERDNIVNELLTS